MTEYFFISGDELGEIVDLSEDIGSRTTDKKLKEMVEKRMAISIKVKNRTTKHISSMDLYSASIESAVNKYINHLKIVYTDDIEKEIGVPNKTLTTWLTEMGFEKVSAKSRRWINPLWKVDNGR
jgi:hypothetical protein